MASEALEQPEVHRRTPAATKGAAVIAAGILVIEVIGAAAMWVPVPFAWLWIGGQVYRLTGSLAADGAVAFLGFVATVVLLLAALRRLDRLWVVLRKRTGYDQEDGALAEVVTVTAAFGLVAFLLWYYFFSSAYVLPFMG
jgi:hypothetical protein